MVKLCEGQARQRHAHLGLVGAQRMWKCIIRECGRVEAKCGGSINHFLPHSIPRLVDAWHVRHRTTRGARSGTSGGAHLIEVLGHLRQDAGSAFSGEQLGNLCDVEVLSEHVLRRRRATRQTGASRGGARACCFELAVGDQVSILQPRLHWPTADKSLCDGVEGLGEVQGVNHERVFLQRLPLIPLLFNPTVVSTVVPRVDQLRYVTVRDARKGAIEVEHDASDEQQAARNVCESPLLDWSLRKVIVSSLGKRLARVLRLLRFLLELARIATTHGCLVPSRRER
mmetsp:Transcript_12778/g.32235  ORF Transcript_12778/g.32235 Transcript_12778/m.32235 type:complete len:284 (-) Transcript_12778:20-871(-)